MMNLPENEISEEDVLDGDIRSDLFLIFETDAEEYALDVASVFEILPMPAVITFVPHVPPYVEGIINLRGDIVPVISVRTRFAKETIPYDDSTCIVVVQHEEYTLGLIVDAVNGVVPITDEQIAPPPNVRLSYSNVFIKSIGKIESGVKLLLDLEKVIFEA